MSQSSIRFVSGPLVVAGVLVSSAAAAQTALQPSSQGSIDQSVSAPDNQLAEITVTAQRRSESVDKVPISMTALSQQTMDDLHIESLADLGSIVPGLYISPVAGGGQDFSEIAIRGILTQSNAPTTQIYIDSLK